MDKHTIAAEICDYLEGALDSDQAARVERLLDSDTTYQTVRAELEQIGQAVRQAPPPLPSGFAKRVAEQVGQQAGQAATEAVRRSVWSNFKILLSGQHPIVSLVEARGTEVRRRLPSFKFIALLCGLPALFLQLVHRDSLGIYLTVQALAMLVALPMFYFESDVAALRSLRRGRCLEDLLCAGVDAAGLVDTLAVHSLRSIARVTLPVLAVLLPTLIFLPPHKMATAFWIGLAWPFAVSLIFWVGSYFSQFQIAWSRRGESPSTPQLLLSLALLAPVCFFFWLGKKSLAQGVGPLTMLFWVTGLTLLVAGSRQLAIWALQNAEQVDRWNERGASGTRGYRNPLVVTSSDNPIAMRENRKRAAAVAGGLVGYLFSVGWPTLLSILWALWLPHASSSLFWLGFTGLALYALLKPLTHTMAAVVGEREKDTWETLLQTGIDQQTFVEGWKEAAASSVFRSLMAPAAILALVPMLVSEKVVGAVYPALALLIGLAGAAGLLLAPWAGASTGLYLTGRSHSMRQAGSQTVSLLGRAAVALLGLWFVLATICSGLGSVGMLNSGADWWEPMVQRLLPMLAFAALMACGGLLPIELDFGLNRKQVVQPEVLYSDKNPLALRLAQGSPWFAAASLSLLFSLPFGWWFNGRGFAGTTVLAFLILTPVLGRWLMGPVRDYVQGDFRTRGVMLAAASGTITSVVLWLVPKLAHGYDKYFHEYYNFHSNHDVYELWSRNGFGTGVGVGLLFMVVCLVMSGPEFTAASANDERAGKTLLQRWGITLVAPLVLWLMAILLLETMAGHNAERTRAVSSAPSLSAYRNDGDSYRSYFRPNPRGNIESATSAQLEEWVDRSSTEVLAQLPLSQSQLASLSQPVLRRYLERADRIEEYFEKKRLDVYHSMAVQLNGLPTPLRHFEQANLWRIMQKSPAEILATDFQQKMYTNRGRSVRSWVGFAEQQWAQSYLKFQTNRELAEMLALSPDFR